MNLFVSPLPPFADSGEHTFGYGKRTLFTAGREAGPVVEVDYSDRAVGINDAVTYVYLDVNHLLCFLTDMFQIIEVKRDTFGMTVDGFQAVFAVAFIKRIKPMEERLAADSVEFDEITHKMSVDYSAFYSTVEVFMKHLLCLLLMAAVAHIFFMHGVEVTALDPARLDSCILHLLDD